MKTICLTVLFFSTHLTSNAQALLPIYDGSLTSQPTRTRVLRSDETVFRQQILPAAKRAWRTRQHECTDGWEGEPAVRGAATGSFTKPKAAQRALLYNYCTPAHAYAFNGVAILESGRVVAHITYQSDWQNDITTAPDVNQNGLSEIVLVAGTTNQGTTWATVTLIEFEENQVLKFGFVQVFSDSCGYSMSEGGESWKISVKPGASPTFYSQTFKRSCHQRRWRRASAPTECQLAEDSTEYVSTGTASSGSPS